MTKIDNGIRDYPKFFKDLAEEFGCGYASYVDTENDDIEVLLIGNKCNWNDPEKLSYMTVRKLHTCYNDDFEYTFFLRGINRYKDNTVFI